LGRELRYKAFRPTDPVLPEDTPLGIFSLHFPPNCLECPFLSSLPFPLLFYLNFVTINNGVYVKPVWFPFFVWSPLFFPPCSPQGRPLSPGFPVNHVNPVFFFMFPPLNSTVIKSKYRFSLLVIPFFLPVRYLPTVLPLFILQDSLFFVPPHRPAPHSFLSQHSFFFFSFFPPLHPFLTYIHRSFPDYAPFPPPQPPFLYYTLIKFFYIFYLLKLCECLLLHFLYTKYELLVLLPVDFKVIGFFFYVPNFSFPTFPYNSFFPPIDSSLFKFH